MLVLVCTLCRLLAVPLPVGKLIVHVLEPFGFEGVGGRGVDALKVSGKDIGDGKPHCRRLLPKVVRSHDRDEARRFAMWAYDSPMREARPPARFAVPKQLSWATPDNDVIT